MSRMDWLKALIEQLELWRRRIHRALFYCLAAMYGWITLVAIFGRAPDEGAVRWEVRFLVAWLSHLSMLATLLTGRMVDRWK